MKNFLNFTLARLREDGNVGLNSNPLNIILIPFIIQTLQINNNNNNDNNNNLFANNKRKRDK